MASQMIEEIMKEPDAVKKYQNKKKLKKKVKKLQLKYQVDKGIIEESIAKQYLKILNVACTRAKYRIAFIGNLNDWKNRRYFREFIPKFIDTIDA